MSLHFSQCEVSCAHLFARPFGLANLSVACTILGSITPAAAAVFFVLPVVGALGVEWFLWMSMMNCLPLWRSSLQRLLLLQVKCQLFALMPIPVAFEFRSSLGASGGSDDECRGLN